MFDALSPLEELIFFFTFALLPFVWASLLAVIGNQVADRISTIVFSILTIGAIAFVITITAMSVVQPTHVVAIMPSIYLFLSAASCLCVSLISMQLDKQQTANATN